jgi:hypothetical protein
LTQVAIGSDNRPMHVRQLIIGLSVVALVLVGCATKKVGDACVTYQASECGGPGGTCLGISGTDGYCSITCKSAAECPKGWKCESVKSTTVNVKTGETKMGEGPSMCIKG